MFAFLRPFVLWLGVQVVCLLLIFSNDNPQAALFRTKVAGLAALGARPFSAVLSIGNLWRENRHLRDVLSQMSIQLAEEREIVAENLRLRRMLEFRQRNTLDLIAANVIGFGAGPSLHSLIIDRGELDGLKPLMPVMAVEGVVGVIFQVSRRTSVVQLLSDPNLGVAGRLQRGREMGMIHAGDGGALRLDGIPISVQISIGDTVMTSGMGGVFPAGLVIGSVQTAAPADDGWLWNIKLKPAVNFEKAEGLYVIRTLNGG